MGPRGRADDPGDTTFAAAMLSQLGLPATPKPPVGETPVATGAGEDGADGSRSSDDSDPGATAPTTSGADRSARGSAPADSAAGRTSAHAREGADAGGGRATQASEADAKPVGLDLASRRAVVTAAAALPASAEIARGAGPMPLRMAAAPEGAAAALAAAARAVARADERSGAGEGHARRAESAMLRASRRAGRSPAFLPAGFVRREIASIGTLLPPADGARAAAHDGPASGAPAAGADMTPALRAWEAQLEGTAAPGEPISLRFEDADGASGTLRLRVQGEALRATLVTADPVLAARLERDLGGLRQSLIDRGFTDARVQVAHAPAASTGGRSAEAEDRRDGGRASRDSQRGYDEPGGDARPRSRDAQQER
jgi:hypothetical protein